MARRIQVTIIGDSASLERSFARSAKAGKSFGLAMDSAGRSVAGMAKKFAEAGIVIGAATGYLIKKAVDFNQQMLLIQTQAGASAAEVSVLGDAILKMSKISPQGPVKLAQGLYHLESLGLRGAKALDTLKIASFAAGMGMANLEETSTALGSVVVTGIKGAQNYSQAMAAIVATVGAGNVRMQDLAGALGNVTPAASSAGITLKEMGAALATLTDRGFSADEATTRFRFALTQIQRPTHASSKALADMGVNANNLGAVIRKPNGLMQVLTILHDAIKKVGVVRGNRDLLAAFGGARSGLGIQTLVQSLDQGLSSYQAKLIQVTQGEKRYAANQKAYLESPGYKLHAMWSQIQADMIVVGNGFIPFGIKVVNGFSTAITGISNFIDKFTHAMNLHWKLNVIWSTAKNLKEKTETLIHDVFTKIDWKRIWAGAKGIDEGLKHRLGAVNWSAVGKKIGDGLTAAVFFAMKGAKKFAGALSDIFQKINWDKLGEKMGPGLATAVVVAFSTLLDPSFWIHHWQIALSIASVAFGDGLGKLGLKMVAPIGRLVEGMAPGLAKFGEDFGMRLLGEIEKVSPRLAHSLLNIGLEGGSLLGKGFSKLVGVADRFLAKLLSPFVKFWRRLSPLFRFTLKILGIDAAINAVSGWASAIWKSISAVAGKIGSSLDDAFKSMRIKAIQAAIDIADPFSSLPGKFGQWARDLKDKWNHEISLMKMPKTPALTGPTGKQSNGPTGPLGPVKPGKDQITAAIDAANSAINNAVAAGIGQNDRGGDRGGTYNSDGTVGKTLKAPPVPKVDSPTPDPSLTTTKKKKASKLLDIFPAKQQEALARAVAANATASTSTDLTVQYSGMQKLVLAYKTALAYLKSEHETGAKRLLQVKEETSLTKAMASVRKSMAAMMATEVDTARQQIGGLFQGPTLQPTEAATGAMLGAPNADPKILLQDLQAQNQQFATWVTDLSKLAKRGAPKELVKELRAGGVGDLEQVQALAGASKAILNKYFATFKQRENLAMKVAKVDMQAGIVHLTGKISGGKKGPAEHFTYSSPSTKTHKQQLGLAGGGVVSDTFGHGGRGGDTVPAWLTPLEIVLNKRHQKGLASMLGMGGSSPHALFNRIQGFAGGGVVPWGKGGQYPVVYNGGKWLFDAGSDKGHAIKQQGLGLMAWLHDNGFKHPSDGSRVNLSHGYLPQHHSVMDKLGSGLGQAVKGFPTALKQTAKALNDDLASASYRIDKAAGTPMLGIEKRAHERDPHLLHNTVKLLHQTVKSFNESRKHPLRDPSGTLLNALAFVPGASLGRLSKLAEAERAGGVVDVARLRRYGGDIRSSSSLGAEARGIDHRLRRDIGPRVLAIPHRYRDALKSERGSVTLAAYGSDWTDLFTGHMNEWAKAWGIKHPDQITSAMAKEWIHSPESYDLNHYLRTGKPLPADMKAIVKRLESSMRPSRKPMTLWRGLGQMPHPDVPAAWERFGKGSTFTEHGFMSTSTEPSVAHEFAYTDVSGDGPPVVMKLHIPPGTRMAKIHPGEWGDQKERLLNRGHQFHVDRVEDMDHGVKLYAHLKAVVRRAVKDQRGSMDLSSFFHGAKEIPGFGHDRMGAFGERPLSSWQNDETQMFVHGLKTKMPHLKPPTSAKIFDAPWTRYFAMLLDKDRGRVFVGGPGALHADLYDKLEDMFKKGGVPKDPVALRKFQNQMHYFEQARGMFSASGRQIEQIATSGLWGNSKAAEDLLRHASERAYKLGAGGFQVRQEEARLRKIPRLAKGGVTTGPTLALIGERGREAVVPLPAGGLYSGPREVIVQIDGREVGRTTLPYHQRTKNSMPVQRRGRSGGSGIGLS